jgi:hypothetical protein
MHDILDIESNLMVAMFQEAYPIGDTETVAGEYLACRSADIERLGRVLKFLGLAEASTKCGLGWKPTGVLLHIIARQVAARPPKASKKQATAKECKIVESLFQLAGGQAEDYVGEDFVFCLLNCLGLLRLDRVGDCKPTRLLRETAKAIFDR